MPNPDQIAEILGSVLGPVSTALEAPGRAFMRAAAGKEAEQETYDYAKNSPYGKLITAGQILAGSTSLVPSAAVKAVPGAAKAAFDPARRQFLKAAGTGAGAAAATMAGVKAARRGEKIGGALQHTDHGIMPFEIYTKSAEKGATFQGYELWETFNGAPIRKYSNKSFGHHQLDEALEEAEATTELLGGTQHYYNPYDGPLPSVIREVD